MSEVDFSCLCIRDIIEIFIGNKQFERYEQVDDSIFTKIMIIKMKYLSGPNICEISKLFGNNVVYHGEMSRVDYFSELLEYCIECGKVNNLLNYLFQKENFKEILMQYNLDEIDDRYKIIVDVLLENINKILSFSDKELIKKGDYFVILNKLESINPETPVINKTIDLQYANDIIEKAKKDITSGDFDSALTKSRTLLEEIFIYAIENKNVIPDKSGDIHKLYKQVKNLYDMNVEKDSDGRIKKILSGLESIVSGITEMRNELGDAHGHGLKKRNINDYHARLAVNSASVMAEFILSVCENSKNRKENKNE